MGLWSEWHYATREIGGWIHNHDRTARVIIYSYTNPRVVQCHSYHWPNAFLLLYHTFTCQFNTSFDVTLIFHCLLLALCDDGCSGVFNRVHTHVLPSSQNVTNRERCHSHLKKKSWTVTGSLSFCRTFHPFIQHHDADALHRRTLWNPDVTLLKQAGWYWLLGFEF